MILRIFCLILALLPCKSFSQEYELVICALFRDESFFLKEWIEYHQLIGVDHFYLYNNLSQDNSLDILKPYIDNGLVDVFDWNYEPHSQQEYLEKLQIPIYEHALQMTKKTSKWAAFIDLDEFIVPKQHDNLKELLKMYEDYGGIAINWQLFGTSNLENIPDEGLIIENLVMKAPKEIGLNQFVKLIVKPEKVKSIGSNPHTFEFISGSFAVNSAYASLPANQRGQNVITDLIQINHYWFGTKQWFLKNKLPRRRNWGIGMEEENLDEILKIYNVEKDETILRFVPELKNHV